MGTRNVDNEREGPFVSLVRNLMKLGAMNNYVTLYNKRVKFLKFITLCILNFVSFVSGI